MSPLPGAKRFEDGIKSLYGFVRSADHHAVAALQAPDAAAGSDIDVVNAFDFKFLGAANVIFEIRVAAVDNGVARLAYAAPASGLWLR